MSKKLKYQVRLKTKRTYAESSPLWGNKSLPLVVGCKVPVDEEPVSYEYRIPRNERVMRIL